MADPSGVGDPLADIATWACVFCTKKQKLNAKTKK